MSMMSPLQGCKVSHGDNALVGDCLGGSVTNGTLSTCPTGYSCGSGYELKGNCCVPVGRYAPPKPFCLFEYGMWSRQCFGVDKIMKASVVVLVIYLITKK